MLPLEALQNHTILMLVGLPILNGSVEHKCGQRTKLLNIHPND